MLNKYITLVLCVTFVLVVEAKKAEEKPGWAKKDIRDYNDADMERLLDQWNVSLFISEGTRNRLQ